MIERREFISICRQIGTMMEVGVDFLRITSALRSQTDNPRLHQLYDQIDEDLRAGDSLSDAMSHAPDIFSPFAVSLVRQGEARGDIEGAWVRIADFYKVEAREDIELGDDAGALEPIGARFRGGGGSASGGRRGFLSASDFFERAQEASVRVLWGLALLLGVLGATRALVESNVIAPRFESLAELGVAALFFALAGIWEARHQSSIQDGVSCAFCGRTEKDGVVLSHSPDNKTAICNVCATQIVQESPATREQREQDARERNQALLGVADALPKGDAANLNDTIILSEDDPLALPRTE